MFLSLNWIDEYIRLNIRRGGWKKYKGNVSESEYIRQIEGATGQPVHYAVVLLKTKDGKKVKTVLEKSGKSSQQVRTLEPNTTIFEPALKKGDQHITYQKKSN